MGSKARISGSVVAGFPSPAEQYQEPPLDLNELDGDPTERAFFRDFRDFNPLDATGSEGFLAFLHSSPLRDTMGSDPMATLDIVYLIKEKIHHFIPCFA